MNHYRLPSLLYANLTMNRWRIILLLAGLYCVFLYCFINFSNDDAINLAINAYSVAIVVSACTFGLSVYAAQTSQSLWLLLPASQTEKWLAGLVMSALVIPLAALGVFILALFTSNQIASSQNAAMSLNDILSNPKWIAKALTFHAIFFFGAIYFKHYRVLKTILLLLLGYLFLFLFGWCLVYYFGHLNVPWSDLSVSYMTLETQPDGSLIQFTKSGESRSSSFGFNLTAIWMIYPISTVFFWILARIRLQEIEAT